MIRAHPQAKNGKKVLMLHDKYIAEFEGEYGSNWATAIIEESKNYKLLLGTI